MKKIYKSSHSWASNKKNIKNKGKRFLQFFINFKNLRSWDKGMLIKNFLLLFSAIFLVGAIIFLAMFAWLSRDLPDPNSLSIREVAQSTKIYDRTGEHLLYEISGDEKRTLVPLEQIPDHVIQATITAEDRKFYDHGGIDFKGIARAIISNITTLNPTGQGASTITQQLVKNAILTNERTYTRKIKEVILALALERRYTKDEIMQLYLNEIAYGSTNYGIQSASYAYFEKDVEDLTLAEAATLASLPKAPSSFLNNPERLLIRRDWILRNMEELNYINEEEMNEALSEETPVSLNVTGINAPHFVLWVKQQLEEEYGERIVEQGGLKVTTTLDWEKQEIAETAVENNYEARSESYGFDNSGLVALDPNNGHILAMVGSADYFNDDIDGQVNIALRPLQPGSSFKPIIYAAGFERGYTPNTILWDVKTTFPTATGAYSPNNYDLSENGPMTIRASLQGSLNVPAVKMLYLVGIKNGLDFAERLHYSTFSNRSNFGLAIVLGGAEVKLLDHVSAYGTFAAEGIYHKPVSILKVEDLNGDLLEEWKENKGERVMDANVANITSNVLSDNNARAYAFGTSSYLTIGSRPVAAKTGTTNDYKDAWTVGYTPNLVAGVWTGNTRGGQMHRGSGGSAVAAPIWNEFMRTALAGQPIDYFTAAGIPETGKAILDGQIPSETIIIDSISGKLATELTPERYREKKTCGEYHTILHYVDRFNPYGDIPSSPEKDFSYTYWETAVQEFLVRQNEELEEGEVALEVCEVPTEEDDIHVKANEPSIEITLPKRNAGVGRTFSVKVNASAPRGISRLEYQIDGSTILVSTSSRGATINLPSWVSIGNHTLSVIAFDDVDNNNSDDLLINVTDDGGGSNITISNPFNNQEIEKLKTTYTVAVENTNFESMIRLEIYATNLWTGKRDLIGSVDRPSAIESIEWNIPDPAKYLINAYGELTDGSKEDATPVNVTVVEKSTKTEEFSLVEEPIEETEEPTVE